MIAVIQVILGSAILSAALTYAWWAKLRVWMLRQDLFAARAELWDAMREGGTLDDPGHRQLRKAINALIRVSPLISIFSVLRVMAEGAHSAQGPNLQSSPPKVREIHDRIAKRLVRYFFRETIIGLLAVSLVVFIGFAILLPLSKIRAFLGRVMSRLLDSSELIAFGRLAD